MSSRMLTCKDCGYFASVFPTEFNIFDWVCPKCQSKHVDCQDDNNSDYSDEVDNSEDPCE